MDGREAEEYAVERWEELNEDGEFYKLSKEDQDDWFQTVYAGQEALAEMQQDLMDDLKDTV